MYDINQLEQDKYVLNENQLALICVLKKQRLKLPIFLSNYCILRAKLNIYIFFTHFIFMKYHIIFILQLRKISV